jgi:hypothetical protein
MNKVKYIDDIYEDKAYHWLMFLKTKNGFYLQKKGIKGQGEDTSEEAFECYCKINDQITQEFGTDESFLTYLKNEEKIALLKLDFIIKKDPFKQTLYEVEEAKKKQSEEGKDSSDFDLNKEIGIISKFMGGGVIDIKTVTIHQYLTAKTLLKNG